MLPSRLQADRSLTEGEAARKKVFRVGHYLEDFTEPETAHKKSLGHPGILNRCFGKDSTYIDDECSLRNTSLDKIES